MKTLENAKRAMRLTMGRILAAAAFSAIALAAIPAHAADKEGGFSDAVYRTGGSQAERQGQARLVPAEFSVGIHLGHGFRGHYGHQKKYYRNGRKFGNHYRNNRSFNRGSHRGFSNRFRGGRQGFSNGRRGGHFGGNRSVRRGIVRRR